MRSTSTVIVASIGLCAVTAHPTERPAGPIPRRQPRQVLASRQFDPADPYVNWPSYSQLPLDASYPTKAAWGVWSNTDVNGALNHINASTILAARSEIQSGQTFSLDLPLEEPSIPINPNRKPLQRLFQPSTGYTDDVVVMNTQVSTQYDGLRHFSYSTNNSVDTYQWYNDLIPDYEDVIGPAPSTVLGIQQAADKAIVARGVLFDFAGYAAAQNLSYDALHTNYSITTSQLDAVAAWQGMPAHWATPGDILFVRTGWLQQYLALDVYDQQILPFDKESSSAGLLAGDDMLEWLWEKKLAMAGADNPAFESTPFAQEIDGVAMSLHQVFIGGWGQSILEFIDLESLAPALHEAGRWSFFVTISPMSIVSGIASPPNAIAIM